jgi:hypothetical protein
MKIAVHCEDYCENAMMRSFLISGVFIRLFFKLFL